MAICFVRAKVIGRSGGKSATAAAAYRSGEKIVDRATNTTHDYTKKQGIDHSEILTPIAAAGKNEWLTDRAELWNRVEAAEKRYDAQLAREMIIAIPRELDRENQIELVREHVQSSYIDRGMVADINLHHLDGDNPHAHVMLTMRELKIDDRGAVSFGNKDRTWNDKKLLETQTKEWEIVANQYLERAGVDTRIDSRSYEEQGVARIPQVHVGAAAWRLEQQGIATVPGDHNRSVAAANRALELAQTEIATAQVNIEIELRLEIERRAAAAAPMERERVAAEAQRVHQEEYTPPEPDPKNDNDKENELGKSLSELLEKWGQRIFHPEDIKLVFYKIKPDQISIYINADKSQTTRICSLKLLDDRWICTVKPQTGQYSIDNLTAMVGDQHHRFDTGAIKKLELTQLEHREILGFNDWCGLELNDNRLAEIRERGREIISNNLANDLVKWIDKNIPITSEILTKERIQEILADSSQPVVIIHNNVSNSVYTNYLLIDRQENKVLDIRYNRGSLEKISGVVTPLAIALITEQRKFTLPTRPDLPELLRRLPTVTGERTCNIGRYQTKQFTNPSIYQDDRLIASYTRVGESWMVKLETNLTQISLSDIETTLYAAVKLKHITANLTRDFQQKFRRADLTDPVIRSLLDETIVAVDRTTPTYDLHSDINLSPTITADLQAQIAKHQEQQRAARQRASDAAATERDRAYIHSRAATQTPSPSPQAKEKEEKGSSLTDRFASFVKELFNLNRHSSDPTPKTPSSTKNQPTQQPQPKPHPTRADLAALAISLLEKMDSKTVSFDDYGIELINNDSSQQILKVSQYGKPLIQMNGKLGQPWASELKNPGRTLDLVEIRLEERLKTYNIKMDLAKDYRDRVIYKIGDVDRSILDNDYVKSTARNIITEGMKNTDFHTYNSNSIVTFNDESIKTLTETINQQIEVERIKSIELERIKSIEAEKVKLVRLKTNQDIVVTAGELRAAYSRKSEIGDTEAVDKIIEVGTRLNEICPDELKVNDKAPDDFKDESIFINRKYILQGLKELQFEIDSQPEIKHTQPERKSQSQDYGMSM